jgi:hypothetical protein
MALISGWRSSRASISDRQPRRPYGLAIRVAAVDAQPEFESPGFGDVVAGIGVGREPPLIDAAGRDAAAVNNA